MDTYGYGCTDKNVSELEWRRTDAHADVGTLTFRNTNTAHRTWSIGTIKDTGYTTNSSIYNPSFTP
jgi:hypothetical protein